MLSEIIGPKVRWEKQPFQRANDSWAQPGLGRGGKNYSNHTMVGFLQALWLPSRLPPHVSQKAPPPGPLLFLQSVSYL